jgi:hypothetical protein
MESDLRVGFGFSEINARIAIDKWVHDDNYLTESERLALEYLADKDPFAIGIKVLKFTKGGIDTLNHLNYRITQEYG